MKKKTLLLFFLACCVLFFESASLGTENKTPNVPSVFVLKSRYEFAPVLDGTEITHDFIVQNRGTAPLTIEKVRTG
jgi:hypothetical protein